MKIHPSLLVTFILTIGGIYFIFFTQPSVTGHVSANYFLKEVKIIVFEDQNYIFSSTDSEPMRLDSVFASGKIVGNGTAKIFLEDEEKRYLLYTNENNGSAMSSVTGFAIKGSKSVDVDVSPEANVLPDIKERGELYPDELQAYMTLLDKEDGVKDRIVDFVMNADGQEFKNKCVATCLLSGLNSASYKLSFEVDAGTLLYLYQLAYSVN